MSCFIEVGAIFHMHISSTIHVVTIFHMHIIEALLQKMCGYQQTNPFFQEKTSDKVFDNSSPQPEFITRNRIQTLIGPNLEILAIKPSTTMSGQNAKNDERQRNNTNQNKNTDGDDSPDEGEPALQQV